MKRLLIGSSSLAAIALTALVVASFVGERNAPHARTSLAVVTSEPAAAGLLSLPEIARANADTATLVSDNAPAN